MTDLVERLRRHDNPFLNEAADEIERLHECLKERDNLCRKLEAAIVAEREACAQLANAISTLPYVEEYTAEKIAAAIRARKDEEANK